MRKLFEKLKQFPKSFWKSCLWAIPFFLALILYFLLPAWPWAAEHLFARGIFIPLSFIFGNLVSLLPFSLSEWLLILSLPLIITAIVFQIRKAKKQQKKWWWLLLKKAGAILSVASLLYMLMFGANYYRHTLSDLMKLDTAQKTKEELYAVCVMLADKASALREKVGEDENGCFTRTASLRQANNGYAVLRNTYPFLSGVSLSPKPVLLSHYWSYTGTTGIFIPFFAEANVNSDIPDSLILSTAAHELAHTRGFAREDECNFLMYLSCLHNDSAEYQYTGNLSAFIYCANALAGADSELHTRLYAEHVSNGMRRDLNQNSQYWKQFEGPVKDIASDINDSFITSQGVPDGVLSYNRVVELILAYHAAPSDA